MPWDLYFRYNLRYGHTFKPFRPRISDLFKIPKYRFVNLPITACMHQTLCNLETHTGKGLRASQMDFKLMKTKCCANGILAQNLPIKNTSDMQTLKIVSGQVRSVELVGECETLIVECNSVSQY